MQPEWIKPQPAAYSKRSRLWLWVQLDRLSSKAGSDASGLSNLLDAQQQEAQANAPGVMGMLGSMLDQNQDGSAINDLKRMAAKFL